jgi:drug/metabolite transporter (DMT)-like permease
MPTPQTQGESDAAGVRAAGRPQGSLDGRAVLVLIIGVASVSTAAVLIRLIDAPPLVIAAYRLVIASAIVVPSAVLLTHRDLESMTRHDVLRAMAAGLFLALHFALWITSLAHTSVASSVVLVTTTPLWVSLAAPFALHERVQRSMYAGVAVAFVGVFVIARGDVTVGGHALFGDLLALGGALAAAAYFLIGRGVRHRVPLLPYVAVSYGTAAIALLAAAVLTRAPMSISDSTTWTYLVLLAVVPQIVGHSSFNWALARLSAPFVAATVLGESVGSTLLAWMVLGEVPPTTTVMGGALILAGLFVAARAEARREPEHPTVHWISPV